MEVNNAGSQSNGLTSQEGTSFGDKFKLTKQLVSDLRPNLKNLAPEAKSLREMGASFDDGAVGMKKVNTAESTKIKTPPELGKGGLVNEVF